MLFIIFKNLLLSLFTTVIAFIVSCLVMLFFDGIIAVEFLKITLSPQAFLIMSSIIAFIVSALWILMTHNRFMTCEDECCKHPPLILFGVLLILLFPVLLGGGSALFLYFLFDKISSGIVSSGEYKFLIIFLSSLTISQVCYIIPKLISVFSWQVCWHCGHIFCYEYEMTSKEEWDETRYRTSTQTENIGSISVDDKKIADIKGNVTRGHYETTHYENTSYIGTCKCCEHLKSRDVLR